jgi:hypothetical protein
MMLSSISCGVNALAGSPSLSLHAWYFSAIHAASAAGVYQAVAEGLRAGRLDRDVALALRAVAEIHRAFRAAVRGRDSATACRLVPGRDWRGWITTGERP